jgi:hypothetical protein
MTRRDQLLVHAARMCGPHRTFRDAILALRNHTNPRIRTLANGCTIGSLCNRLRPYRAQMLRPLCPGAEFINDPAAKAVLHYVLLTLPHLPDDDPEIAAARRDLLRVHRLARFAIESMILP